MNLKQSLRLAIFALLTSCALAVVDPIMQLNYAILKGQPDKVASLLAGNPGLANQTTKGGMSPLQGAVGLTIYKPEIVQALVLGGADLNYASPNGLTALVGAINSKNLAATTQLLQLKANPNKPGMRGLSPLHWAVLLSDQKIGVQMVDLLIQAGAKVDVLGPDKHTPLHSAILRAVKDDAGTAPMVELLLRGKADPNLKLQLGQAQVSTLDFVKQFKLPKTQEVLVRYGAKSQN